MSFSTVFRAVTSIVAFWMWTGSLLGGTAMVKRETRAWTGGIAHNARTGQHTTWTTSYEIANSLIEMAMLQSSIYRPIPCILGHTTQRTIVCSFFFFTTESSRRPS